MAPLGLPSRRPRTAESGIPERAPQLPPLLQAPSLRLASYTALNALESSPSIPSSNRLSTPPPTPPFSSPSIHFPPSPAMNPPTQSKIPRSRLRTRDPTAHSLQDSNDLAFFLRETGPPPAKQPAFAASSSAIPSFTATSATGPDEDMSAGRSRFFSLRKKNKSVTRLDETLHDKGGDKDKDRDSTRRAKGSLGGRIVNGVVGRKSSARPTTAGSQLGVHGNMSKDAFINNWRTGSEISDPPSPYLPGTVPKTLPNGQTVMMIAPSLTARASTPLQPSFFSSPTAHPSSLPFAQTHKQQPSTQSSFPSTSISSYNLSSHTPTSPVFPTPISERRTTSPLGSPTKIPSPRRSPKYSPQMNGRELADPAPYPYAIYIAPSGASSVTSLSSEPHSPDDGVPFSPGSPLQSSQLPSHHHSHGRHHPRQHQGDSIAAEILRSHRRKRSESMREFSVTRGAAPTEDTTVRMPNVIPTPPPEQTPLPAGAAPLLDPPEGGRHRSTSAPVPFEPMGALGVSHSQRDQGHDHSRHNHNHNLNRPHPSSYAQTQTQSQSRPQSHAQSRRNGNDRSDHDGKRSTMDSETSQPQSDTFRFSDASYPSRPSAPSTAPSEHSNSHHSHHSHAEEDELSDTSSWNEHSVVVKSGYLVTSAFPSVPALPTLANLANLSGTHPTLPIIPVQRPLLTAGEYVRGKPVKTPSLKSSKSSSSSGGRPQQQQGHRQHYTHNPLVPPSPNRSRPPRTPPPTTPLPPSPSDARAGKRLSALSALSVSVSGEQERTLTLDVPTTTAAMTLAPGTRPLSLSATGSPTPTPGQRPTSSGHSNSPSPSAFPAPPTSPSLLSTAASASASASTAAATSVLQKQVTALTRALTAQRTQYEYLASRLRESELARVALHGRVKELERLEWGWERERMGLRYLVQGNLGGDRAVEVFLEGLSVGLGLKGLRAGGGEGAGTGAGAEGGVGSVEESAEGGLVVERERVESRTGVRETRRKRRYSLPNSLNDLPDKVKNAALATSSYPLPLLSKTATSPLATQQAFPTVPSPTSTRHSQQQPLQRHAPPPTRAPSLNSVTSLPYLPASKHVPQTPSRSQSHRPHKTSMTTSAGSIYSVGGPVASNASTSGGNPITSTFSPHITGATLAKSVSGSIASGKRSSHQYHQYSATLEDVLAELGRFDSNINSNNHSASASRKQRNAGKRVSALTARSAASAPAYA
ncbi:hypothetical protein BOTBODRAFT_58823 [Botryobasidium botryosum FD-172 SS1]|uniref:Uncharacterized protein n=1 Tax=Botryobasidium botryosum (strain FD-172 SS1) TaxID=930990 RepID=A0A067MC57_BOTB1|nr:hypothetical protein BOTBODRAFT_58823 [Botryobasidium botryosum FD-172 SS1]